MARELSSMYSSMPIWGMDEEEAHVGRMLECAELGEKTIALISLNGTSEWLFGRCSFPYPADERAPFRFVDRFMNLKGQNVLPVLIREQAVTLLLTDEEALAEQLRTDPTTRRYAGLVIVLTSDGRNFRRGSPPPRKSILARLGLSGR